MGRRARFRGAKAAPKTLEKDLLEKSRMLALDPKLLMPRCTKECRRCDLKKAQVKMAKVAERRLDPKKLEFSMNWGDHLVRAYAATISLHLAGKIRLPGRRPHAPGRSILRRPGKGGQEQAHRRPAL